MSDAIFKKLTVEELEEQDILVSVDSLKNYVASRNLDGAGLQQLLCELLAAGQGGMLNAASGKTVRSFLERFSNSANIIAPEVAKAQGMPVFPGAGDDVTFFRGVLSKSDEDWTAKAEKRWFDAAKERLAEIQRSFEAPREIGPAEQRQIDLALRTRGSVTAF